jgi:hypothetical protein
MAADDAVARIFLDEARRHFALCAGRIRHCVEQLSDEQLWWRAGEDFNSIANLLLHLSGNIGERIVSLIGGEPTNRDRDQEFAERRRIPKAELLARFDQTLARTDAVLASLDPARLSETRRYRMLAGDVEGTLVTLIMQTLVHLGGHTQEIVAMTRGQLKDRYRFQQPRSPQRVQ